MTRVATARATAARAPAAPRPAIRRPLTVLAAGLGFGILGQAVLFDVAVGANAPLLAAVLLALAWLVRASPRSLPVRDAWLAPAAIAFAAVAAVRADTTIVAVSLLVSAGLVAGATASLAGSAILARPFTPLVTLLAGVAGWIAGGVAFAFADVARTRTIDGRGLRAKLAPLAAVGRGLLIAVPIVSVFVVLLTSADAVFADLVDGLVDPDLDLGDAIGRTALGAVLAWIACGLLGRSASPEAALLRARPEGGSLPTLGTVEVITVLAGVVVVFGVFVPLQAAYLFGGLDTLEAIGLTYAEYARRGFFELVAVAVLAGGLVIALDRVVARRTRAFVAVAFAVVALTGLILVSAALRLRLYQEAYGWTELRLYVVATIVFGAAALASTAVAILTDRVRWLGHAFVVIGLAVALALAVLGPVRFITEQNVARVLQPDLVADHGATGLDTSYVLGLGDDAIPALVRALPALDGFAARDLRMQLAARLETMRSDPALTGPFAWNLGREAARAALEDAERRGLFSR